MSGTGPAVSRALGEVVQGRFRLLAVLGQGAFGTVYRAEQQVSGRPCRQVALKITQDTDQGRGVDRAREALRVAQALDASGDPGALRHVVRTYDAGEVPPSAGYVCMELCRGSLRDLAHHPGRATAGELLERFIGICRPLAWLHSRPVPLVHRDVKPDNMLLGYDGAVKLADFGLLAAVESAQGGAPVAGTLPYLAPETLRSAEQRVYTPRADVYSLGLSWYEILTGAVPGADEALSARQRFRAESGREPTPAENSAFWLRVREAVPHPLSQASPQIAPDSPVGDIILRCLQPEPERRFADAQELLAALVALRDYPDPALGLDEALALAHQAEQRLLQADYDDAVTLGQRARALEQARPRRERHPGVYVTLIRAYGDSGDLDRAQQTVEGALERLDCPEVALAGAEVAERRGEAEAAAKLRQRARGILPVQPAAAHQLSAGLLERVEGTFEERVGEYMGLTQGRMEVQRSDVGEPVPLSLPAEGVPTVVERLEKVVSDFIVAGGGTPITASAVAPADLLLMASDPGLGIAPAVRESALVNVEFACIHPKEVEPLALNLLVAAMHVPEALTEAVHRAYALQSEAGRAPGDLRTVGAGRQTDVPRTAEVTVIPTLSGADLRPSERLLSLWEDDFVMADFQFRAGPESAGRALNGEVSFYLGGLVIATVPVSMFVVGKGVAVAPEAPGSRSTAQAYRRIFASYSHQDAAIVDWLAEWARAFGDEYLRDVQTLRAGEEWGPRLVEMIEQADVFQLFWSPNSSRSHYVEEEWRHALRLTSERPSFIRPVYWEDAAVGLVPDELRHLHFQRLKVPHLDSTYDASS